MSRIVMMWKSKLKGTRVLKFLIFNSNKNDYKLVEKSMIISILKCDDLKVEKEIDIWNHVINWGARQIEYLEEKRRQENDPVRRSSPRRKKARLIGLGEKDI